MAQIPTNVDIFGCLSFLKEIYIYFEEPIGFSTCPKKSQKNLEREMENLKRIQRDVTKIFQEQEQRQPGTKCKVVVKRWWDDVNGIDTEVNTLLHDLQQTCSCICCCFPCQNYRLGKKVVDLIKRVNLLVEEGKKFDDDKSLVRSIYDPINNVPHLSTLMVGRDGKSSEIHGYLRDSQVTIIGIWGMGGIGKTTMLKSIKHALSGNDHDFHYIIWIEMSQNEYDILKIQKQIAECIFPSDVKGKEVTMSQNDDDYDNKHKERKNERMLQNALQGRKSLLLIDNVWKELDFERIGIPFAVGTDFVKILFTTRSKEVCTDMRAQKIVRLDSLDQKESKQLFKRNISPDVDLTHDKIVGERVDEICKICGGVPLVIVTVARTVANYTRVEEWDHAVECLRSSLQEIKGIDQVMRCLKFSYDKLEDDKIKSCLLYLSLFPEGAQINTDDVIKEWVAEGFLDTPNDNSFTRSYNRGVDEIKKLKSICLVEESVYSDDQVKLHDVIRHMLCWIREQENKEVFIVYNDQTSDCNYDRWDLAKRIYLFESQVKGLPETGMPLCSNLTSLLVENDCNRIDKLPTEEFFHFTPSLRVLDLSFTGLVDIPKSIGELVELRCLNLSRTRIHTVPMELGNLKKLKWLDLGNTFQLVTIVGSAISELCALQSLNLLNTSYQWNSDDVNMTTRPPLLKLEDLRALKNLEDLGMDVRSNSHLDTILNNKMLLKSIARISFILIDFTTIDLGGLQLIEWISQRLPKLKNLIVEGCALAPDILEIKNDQLPLVTQLSLWSLKISSATLNEASCPFSRLKILQIFYCERLKEVSWTARIPYLEQLQVKNCYSVKELVEEEEEEEKEEIREERKYFPKLYKLEIKDLRNLERIHGRSPLLFPALRFLTIKNCPKLKQLSFDDDSAKNMEYIKCEKIQWDLLEWENDQLLAKFSPYFHRIPDRPPTMVGRDGKSSEIHGYLRDSQVTTIGIWGMGGIGKTTMLKSIKHWLSGNDHDFHYIIWIEMSQNEDGILNIQKQITSCIFPSLPPEHEERENARMLLNALRVLDLSFTGLVDIPNSIGELVELRYLNLSRTRIHTVPMQLGNLKKLKCLDLGNTSELLTIVGSSISELCALQSLNLLNTSYQWNSDGVNMTTRPPLLKLEDLRALKNLDDLGMDVRSNSHLYTILSDKMLLKSITRISFILIDFTTINLGGLQPIEYISNRLPELIKLIVDGCALVTDILEIKDDLLPLVTQLCLWSLKISSVTLNDASRPFSRLKVLQIMGCQRLKEVSWTACIPSLEQLQVKNCYSVKELVEEEEEEKEETREERDYFPKLYRLEIKDLRNLERIHGRSPLLFPAFRQLVIQNCPKLKQLSFGDDSAKNMEYIVCEEIQWDLLEWENDRVRAKFSPYFHRIPDPPPTVVGRDGKSSEIHGYLRDSQVTTIGILGMGGIGKTTMLKSIKQWLSETDHDFHYIIWIEMSQNDDDVIKIQKQIASCIFTSLPPEHKERENARMLLNALRGKKSLVLIDNVWKKLDFERIGIPFETDFVKILFTTRSQKVCTDMRAQNIVRLDSLENAESL